MSKEASLYLGLSVSFFMLLAAFSDDYILYTYHPVAAVLGRFCAAMFNSLVIYGVIWVLNWFGKRVFK